jgi:hypothetical protein
VLLVLELVFLGLGPQTNQFAFVVFDVAVEQFDLEFLLLVEEEVCLLFLGLELVFQLVVLLFEFG